EGCKSDILDVVPVIDNHVKSDAGQVVFFFQAEDGIRDRNVTGVQTCALPILLRADVVGGPAGPGEPGQSAPDRDLLALADLAGRSEERRVGKECRSRWSSDL